MKVECILVGKTKDAWVEEGMEEYCKRLSPYVLLDIIVVKESKASSPQKRIQEEGEAIQKQLRPEATRIVLDVTGRTMTSEAFAQKVLAPVRSKGGLIQFVIGGTYGISDALRSSCSMRLSFSPMTFTHQMVRVILLEQVYRGVTILVGKQYHY